MDEWGDDAYAVIYDDHDRERTVKTSNSCCAIPFIFFVVALVVVIAV